MRALRQHSLPHCVRTHCPTASAPTAPLRQHPLPNCASTHCPTASAPTAQLRQHPLPNCASTHCPTAPAPTAQLRQHPLPNCVSTHCPTASAPTAQLRQHPLPNCVSTQPGDDGAAADDDVRVFVCVYVCVCVCVCVCVWCISPLFSLFVCRLFTRARLLTSKSHACVYCHPLFQPPLPQCPTPHPHPPHPPHPRTPSASECYSTSLYFFKMVHNNLDLGCVFLPAPTCAGGATKTRLKSNKFIKFDMQKTDADGPATLLQPLAMILTPCPYGPIMALLLSSNP